jgi:glycosyltransferase involved in cell wall biosynthesis
MRIGIDGSAWLNRRGYGRFLRNVAPHLLEIDEGTRYVMYVDEHTAARISLPEGAERRLVRLRRAVHEATRAESHRTPADILRMALAVSRDRLDAFVFPSLHTYVPVVGTPTLLGVHDTIPEAYPELTHPGRRARAFAALKRAVGLRRSAMIFTVSEASRQALAEQFGLPPGEIAVVPEAPDPTFHPRPAGVVAETLAPLGLEPGRLFVTACGISPHKNLERLVAAYALLAAEQSDVPPLVIAGDTTGDTYVSAGADVVRAIEAHGLADRILLPGHVSDETLACLYAGATAAVVPSLAEGFGLPAVEAAACGAPLVLSDVPAHRETLDGAALFVPPTDVGAIAKALGDVLTDGALRASLGERASRAVSGLSWKASADALHAAVLTTASGTGRARV